MKNRVRKEYSQEMIGELVGIQAKSVRDRIRKYSNVLEQLGEIKIKETKTSKIGRKHRSYILTTKAQLGFLSSIMSKSAEVEELNKLCGDTVFVLKRKANSLCDVLEAMIKGAGYTSVREYKIGKYSVDLAIFFGEPDIKTLVGIVEIDGYEHEYHKILDNIRMNDILSIIFENRINFHSNDKFPFIRIDEKDELKGIEEVSEIMSMNISIENKPYMKTFKD